MERTRERLIAQLIDLITSGLDHRSCDELQTLVDTMQRGLLDPRDALRSADNSVLVYLNPKTTKEATLSAISQLADWVDENWEVVEERDLSGDKVFSVAENDLPN